MASLQHRGDASVLATSPSDEQLMGFVDSRTSAKAKMKTQRSGVPCITSGGCPFATKQAAQNDSPREDVLKAELALCFEEATRRFLTSIRNSANITDGLDADSVTASKVECASSPFCRHRGVKRCDASNPFREADGRCNNLEHPDWGAAGSCMRRLLPPAYADGVSSPRVSVKSGRALPSARRLSYTVHPQRTAFDRIWSAMTVHFAQFVTHDISAALVVDEGGPEFSQNLGRDTYECCGANSNSDPECFPIDIPAEDPFYSSFRRRCMNFKRSAPCLTCRMGHRDQVNFVTSYIDGSPVYGVSENQTRSLRLLNSGDRRINQNSGLLLMHTIWFREHNRVARKMAQINPHWDDERLFQVSRRIVEARLQHIVYNELLKELLGPEGVKRNQLSPLREGYTTYDATVDATVYNEFTTAALRLGHSLVDADNETLYLPDKRKLYLPLRLNWFNPFAFYDADVIDAVTASRLRKPPQKIDRYGTYAVTRHAFRFPDGPDPFGVDLFAFDIQRGRDHGVRPYVDYVHHCSPDVRLNAFEHLEKLMPRDAAELYAGLYADVRDVDLFSAGLAEGTLPASMVGPTFACLIGPMFRRLKYGDRFYYEHGGQAGSFTPGQLRTIRQTTLAHVICANSDAIREIQPSALRLERPGNRLTACSKLTDIDFLQWKEIK
ncbi:chorion peroxidase [Rhipicephalus sanguineus]|uniref:chorion peroxidase n=1 Tax=Rhipicephalus sanguineus TaxID=34632 RepID=UPI0020C2B9EC|nr:chorion peroxidase [Rhipicephalus sanguineus]